MHNEMPEMISSTYGSSTANHLAAFGLAPQAQMMGKIHQLCDRDDVADSLALMMSPQVNNQPQQNKQEQQMSALRVVRVYIADTNEAIPMDKRILHTSNEKLTELTDQELFFEVPMAEMLAKHNAYRITVVDKKASEKFGRDVLLEPVRIKDLKMVVVTIAQF